MSVADTNPDYWSEYSNLQHVKHAIIRNYLNGWFPKLTLGESGVRRLLYIDTHAGRGKHLSGELGSPLVALTTLLEHSAMERILRRAEVRYIFIERDEANLESLRQELSQCEVPSKVIVDTADGDCFEIITGAIDRLEEQGRRLAPGFIFLDPYGFRIPGQLLRRIMKIPKTELFVNVIWRELDMAIALAKRGSQPGMVRTLDSVFDGDGWRQIDAGTSDERAEQCADVFRAISGAQWGTHIRMMDNNRIRYFLLHLTNHDAGRDLMKECIWNACPDGGFLASKSDNPRQRLLIEPEPDLGPLRQWIRDQLATAPRRWKSDLTSALRRELWLGKHLNGCVRDMRREGMIAADSYEGQFAAKNNPLLHLAEGEV
ncbi:hypothetical protein Mal4_05170 [Maioricimonas rarisocia]|uniref:Three-Cys-motif partner protein TcmP n=1 Tax=Maioricimonas rarisocia TaxID=2528026 RepID=A0A517Z188_9PLAN|nr:three-Cys-motif partner protein TcmP [Maioricimonas rarisocia]QDU36233.1 hypothetical protein Mal4_05170 [Maioricimonas rarisocia]